MNLGPSTMHGVQHPQCLKHVHFKANTSESFVPSQAKKCFLGHRQVSANRCSEAFGFESRKCWGVSTWAAPLHHISTAVEESFTPFSWAVNHTVQIYTVYTCLGDTRTHQQKWTRSRPTKKTHVKLGIDSSSISERVWPKDLYFLLAMVIHLAICNNQSNAWNTWILLGYH